MDEREKWNIMHLYRHYASLDGLPDIKCPECDDDTYPIVDTDTSPALQCFGCKTVIHLGAHVYDQMQANIKELEESVKRAI